MKNHPENGVIETPGNGDGKHAAETPKADASDPPLFSIATPRLLLCVPWRGTFYSELRRFRLRSIIRAGENHFLVIELTRIYAELCSIASSNCRHEWPHE